MCYKKLPITLIALIPPLLALRPFCFLEKIS